MFDAVLQAEDVSALGLCEILSVSECTLAKGGQVQYRTYETVNLALTMADGSIVETAVIPVVLVENTATALSSSVVSSPSSAVYTTPTTKGLRQEISSAERPAAFARVEPRVSPPGSPPVIVAVIEGSKERLLGFGALTRLNLTLDFEHCALLRRLTKLRA